jgi:hypothetical protein
MSGGKQTENRSITKESEFAGGRCWGGRGEYYKNKYGG